MGNILDIMFLLAIAPMLIAVFLCGVWCAREVWGGIRNQRRKKSRIVSTGNIDTHLLPWAQCPDEVEVQGEKRKYKDLF